MRLKVFSTVALAVNDELELVEKQGRKRSTIRFLKPVTIVLVLLSKTLVLFVPLGRKMHLVV